LTGILAVITSLLQNGTAGYRPLCSQKMWICFLQSGTLDHPTDVPLFFLCMALNIRLG
jgi:hypothetical protein